MTRRNSPDDFSLSVPTPLVESETKPFAVVTVGRERSGAPRPCQLWVWNDSPARTIALELTRGSKLLVGDSTESLVTDETRYDADVIFAIKLREPATYVLDIAVEGTRKTPFAFRVRSSTATTRQLPSQFAPMHGSLHRR